MSLRYAASDTGRPALLMGERGFAVGIVVVAPGTSSSVGRVLGKKGDVEGRRCSFFVFNKLSRRSVGMSTGSTAVTAV